jgi:hypothetical protein
MWHKSGKVMLQFGVHVHIQTVHCDSVQLNYDNSDRGFLDCGTV